MWGEEGHLWWWLPGSEGPSRDLNMEAKQEVASGYRWSLGCDLLGGVSGGLGRLGV
jgi:hypothetical protein